MPGQKEVALYIESPPMPTRMSWSMLGMDRLENLWRKRPLLAPIRNYSAREIAPDEHQASPKSCFYPVPQNALYVSAGMNPVPIPS